MTLFPLFVSYVDRPFLAVKTKGTKTTKTKTTRVQMGKDRRGMNSPWHEGPIVRCIRTVTSFLQTRSV